MPAMRHESEPCHGQIRMFSDGACLSSTVMLSRPFLRTGVVSPLSSIRLRGPHNSFAHERLADTMCADSLINSSGCGSVSCRLTADTRPAAHCRNGRASGLQPRTECDHGLPLKPGGQSGSLDAIQALLRDWIMPVSGSAAFRLPRQAAFAAPFRRRLMCQRMARKVMLAGSKPCRA